jgi:predicted ArsR family transcriptional regulator
MEYLGILIPLAPFLMVSFIVWTKHQSKMAELRIRDTAEKAAQYASHSAELEERVRILERIVTDKGYDVASQIEALRDTRKVEALLEHREKEV